MIQGNVVVVHLYNWNGFCIQCQGFNGYTFSVFGFLISRLFLFTRETFSSRHELKLAKTLQWRMFPRSFQFAAN